tara:strand:+ start:3699 stop:3881 length:183 start_codon:yes stop_codon:yes gene_type:complete
MEKTINDLIKELQALKPELRDLPVKVRAENGLLFEPKAKILLNKLDTIFDTPEEMIITYD